jgi:hypothetical protein
LALSLAAAPGRAQESRSAELEREIAALRQQVEALAAQQGESAPPTEGSQPDPRLAELERRIEALAAEVERLQLGEAAAAEADEGERGMGPAASKVYRAAGGISLGGYGELLYQGFDGTRDDGAPSGKTDEIDLLRAVFYFGYKWNDRLLFNSEVEYEHAKAGEGQKGEVAVEFAYVDWLWRPQLNLRGGLLLVPMGLVNELHEPTVFPSARRPGLESAILPTTWRENGAGVYGDIGPWSYRAYLLNGMDAVGFSAAGLRGGRQNGARAKANDLAWVGRLDYTGLPGLLAGGSVYLGDSGQELDAEVATRIFEAHADWRWRGWELRGVWARAELDGVEALNAALGATGDRSVGEESGGYYLQAGFDVFSLWLVAPWRREQSLTPFVRFEEYDTQQKVPAGAARNPVNDNSILTLGIAYRPIDRLIVKLDFQDNDNAASTGTDQVNLALGWVF